MPAPLPPAQTTREAADALPPGTRLAEFEIRTVLGVGGFGIVYRAWDHALEREVALKEYMPSAFAARGDGEQVVLRAGTHAETFGIGLRSFVNEARLLARFDHPSLVKVYRFWEEHGTAYMVMPYYRGRTLRQVRQALAGPPDEAACRRIIDPLLEALELLHRQDVFHRDIAPDNIVVDDDGAPVLLDFGAARRAVSGRTQSLTAILKPNFAPLEQYADVSSMRQGPWTDLYGLGATVYYFITGQAPLPAAARALHDELMPLTHLAPAGCSGDFLAAIDWTLALRPPDRPPTAATLRDVLEGRMAVPATARRDVTQPGVTARSVGGWSAQAIAPTVILSPAPAPAPKGAGVDESSPASEVAAAAPPAAVEAVAATGPAVRARPVPRRRAWPFAAVVATVMMLAALWWVASPRRTSAGVAALPVAQSPVLERSAAEPATPAPAVPVRSSAAATVHPAADATPASELCAGRGFLARIACLKRECDRPELDSHPACRRMRAMEQKPPEP
jgi:hypothetical protein